MKTITIMSALALFATASAASAAPYAFTFTGEGTTPSGSGTLTTSDVMDAAGGYDITGINGIFAGATITGLVVNPNQPAEAVSSGFTYDNVLFPAASLKFDRYGIAFTANGTQYNIYNAAADGRTPPTGFPYGLLTSSSSTPRYGSFALAAAVPEPATWAMMMVGFGMIGFGLRRRKSNVTTTVRFA